MLLESFEGIVKAEKAVSELIATDVNTENRMTICIKKLDKVFESEKIDEAYLTYSKFIYFQKSSEISMTDYVIEFEHLYCKMTNYEMSVPNGVLTFKLLDSARLTDDNQKLSLTLGSSLEFEIMKSASKRIFTKSTSTAEPPHDFEYIK